MHATKTARAVIFCPEIGIPIYKFSIEGKTSICRTFLPRFELVDSYDAEATNASEDPGVFAGLMLP